jgi:hypothetical protein
MSVEVILDSVWAARVSSSCLPYLPRVSTPMGGMVGILGGRGEYYNKTSLKLVRPASFRHIKIFENCYLLGDKSGIYDCKMDFL